MKIALFLGAGASVPYGKPTTQKFKEILLDKYINETKPQYLNNFLRNQKFRDIEHILQSIKEIRSFLNGYGGKFFSGLYTLLKIHSHGRLENFDNKFFEEAIGHVENIIIDEIYERYRWDDKINEELVKILNKLFSLFNLKNGIHVFTTNYDNAIETFCDITQKHKPIDGFKHNIRGRNYLWENFFTPPDHDEGVDVFLHKLHGSLDWKQLHNGKIVKTAEESKPADPRYKHNMVIYPTLSPKDEETQEPYKTIIHRFEKFMDTADVCIVIGYSFRDHLNDTFLKFLDRGYTKLIIVSPTAMSDLSKNLLKEKEKTGEQNKLHVKKIFVKNLTNTAGKTSRLYCIQESLNIKTIDDIIQDIKTCLDDGLDDDLEESLLL